MSTFKPKFNPGPWKDIPKDMNGDDYRLIMASPEIYNALLFAMEALRPGAEGEMRRKAIKQANDALNMANGNLESLGEYL